MLTINAAAHRATRRTGVSCRWLGECTTVDPDHPWENHRDWFAATHC